MCYLVFKITKAITLHSNLITIRFFFDLFIINMDYAKPTGEHRIYDMYMYKL